MIHFYVYRAPKRPKPKTVKYPAVFLFDDNWDDFGYKTLFDASIRAKFEREMPLPVQIYLDSILPDGD
jgi:hypothetical protein